MLYFTIIYGILDTNTGEGKICQAGHPYPLLCNTQGQVSTLGKGGFPIGLLDDAHYEDIDFTLLPGERLLLYSDGISECQNHAEEQYGMQRLQKSFSNTHQLSLKQSLQQLKTDAQDWYQTNENINEPFKDDMSLLVLELTG